MDPDEQGENRAQELVRNSDGTFVKGAPSPNPGGRPKGSKNMSTALRELLADGALEEWQDAMRRALSDEKSRAFASASKLAFEYTEGKPVDSTDRKMDTILSRIELVPGRPVAPLEGFEQLEKGAGSQEESPESPLEESEGGEETPQRGG